MSSLSTLSAAVFAATAVSFCRAQTWVALQVYYSYTHQDNAVVATPASIASLDNTYTYVTTDLAAFSASEPQPAGTVPLNFYANTATGHHMTTASDTGNAYARANGFALQRVEAWVTPVGQQGAGDMPLDMWFGAARGDHFLVGTTVNQDNAKAAGYVFQYHDCFVPRPPTNWTVWPNLPPAGLPFPRSADLLSYEYAYGNNAVTPGIGADTWYPSWAADGNLYSSWTDGTVDGVKSGSGGQGATTGFAVVHGDDPFNLSLSGVAVFAEPAGPYEGRYPSLNFYHGGVWYYGTYSLENFGAWPSPAPDCGNWCIQGPFTEVRYSFNDGVNWTAPRRTMANYSDNLFGETAFNNSKVCACGGAGVGAGRRPIFPACASLLRAPSPPSQVKFGAPHAVDFGQENVHSPDGRLYIIGHGAEGPASHQSWMQGDSVYMARTAGAPSPATINDAAQWQFWAGGDVWSSAIADAKPLFVWPGRTGVVTLSWHPALAKYIMVVSTPSAGCSTVGTFDTYFLESDAMTGPFALISYLPAFGPEACEFINRQASGACDGGRDRTRLGVPATRSTRLHAHPAACRLCARAVQIHGHQEHAAVRRERPPPACSAPSRAPRGCRHGAAAAGR